MFLICFQVNKKSKEEENCNLKSFFHSPPNVDSVKRNPDEEHFYVWMLFFMVKGGYGSKSKELLYLKELFYKHIEIKK